MLLQLYIFIQLHVPGAILDTRNIAEDIIYVCLEKMYRQHIFNLLPLVT